MDTETLGRIAIIGLAGRFPGAGDLEQFWRNLVEGVDSVTRFSAEELLAAGVDPELVARQDYVRAAGVLADARCFDHELFGISPREASHMDPQQRVFLECAWEALEQAGYEPWEGRVLTGVFAGSSSLDYLLHNLGDQLDIHQPTRYLQAWVGNDKDYLATQTAYRLNLRGPAVSVQTACSSSLVSVVLATQSLLTYQCDMALAGGVTVAEPQVRGYVYEEGNIVSPDGRCRSFDAAAQGTVFGNGAGVVVLKRLEDAERDGDTVHAVLLGAAANNDGSLKVGFTAPSVTGQSEVIALALSIADVSADSLSYVEAHGTGTALGDPIEVAALNEVFAAQTRRRGFCALGSVKSNVGHLNAASGVAGLIKTVLALKHRQIPPSLHYREPNPAIDFPSSPFYVADRLREWEEGATPRRAGVSSFGIGGTNAHVVLEEAGAPRGESAATAPGPHLLCLSAASGPALGRLADRWAEFLAAPPEAAPGDLCRTANLGRAALPHRLALVADDVSGMRETLDALRRGEESPRGFSGTAADPPRRLAFVMSGQGSQVPGMGRQLYADSAVFRDTLDRCSEILEPSIGAPLSSILFPEPAQEEPLLHETRFTQPALFAYQMALVKLLASQGATPQVVFGHSLGEVAAACLAGVLRLEDALRLVAERGRLMGALPAGGAMASVFAAPDQVLAELEPFGGRVAVAAFNGPEHLVVSGEAEAVREVCGLLEARGVRSRRLRVSHAFHSPLMEAVLDPFEEVVAGLELSPPKIELVSSMTGEPIGDEIVSPEYWRKSLVAPVRFHDAMRSIVRSDCRHFYEIGPRSSLREMARAFLTPEEASWAPAFQRDLPDSETLRRGQAYLFVHGLPLAMSKVEGGRPYRRSPAPTYPFERREHWIEPAAVPRRETHGEHPLLGRPVRSPLLESTLFENELSLRRVPYLDDHRIYGAAVVSGAALVSMALDAAHQCFGAVLDLTEVLFPSALVLPEEGGRTVQLLVNPALDGRAGIKLISLDPRSGSKPGGWSIHLAGSVADREDPPAAELSDVDRERLGETLDPEELTALLRGYQVELGPTFRWIREVFRGDGEALCRLERPQVLPEEDPYLLHPGLVDSCFQVIAACLSAEGGDTFVPFSIRRCRVSAPARSRQLWCHGVLRETDSREGRIVADLRLFDDGGGLVAELEGFESRRAAPARFLRERHEEWVHTLAWREKTPVSATVSSVLGAAGGDGWLVLGAETGLGRALAARLRQDHGRCVQVAAAADFAQVAGDRWRLDPAQEEHWTRLWGELFADGKPPVRGILHLWSLMEDSAPIRAATLSSTIERSCGAVPALLRALFQTGHSQLPRLVVATRGAHSVNGEPVPESGLGGGTLWGLSRVLMTEHPSLGTTLIDLEAGLDEDGAVESLVRELSCRDAENQLALRGGRRYALRLSRQRRRSAPERSSWAPEASGRYLVTGGLGALGLSLTRWLVAHGARHLLLCGRSEPSAAARKAIEEAEQGGAEVRFQPADVSRREDVEALVAAAHEEGTPLRGVFHAAGTLDDSLLVQLTWPRFETVLAPKVAGTWWLHKATLGLDLDAFVCFSSIAAILGSPGQANYSAANAFQDALMHHRRATGQPGLSVNWGPWSGDGMAASMAGRNRRRLSELGLGRIDREAGWTILAELLGDGVTQAGVLPVDWARYVLQLPTGAAPPLLADLTAHLRRDDKARDAVLAALRAAHPGERREMLTEHVRSQVIRILGLDEDEPIEPDQSLFDFDLDSLLAMDLRNSLESSLGVSLNATVVFNNPTLETLVDYLAREALDLGFDAAAETGGEAPEDATTTPDASLDELRSLSETLDRLSSNELSDLLARKLTELGAGDAEGRR